MKVWWFMFICSKNTFAFDEMKLCMYCKKTLSYAFLCLIYLQKWHHFCILLQAPIKITNLLSISFSPLCLATLISLFLRTLKRKVNMRKELNDSMIICVKSISNFMCISSSVSHELCGHAKGQERNLSTLFGRTRRLRWGKLFWRRHLILHFCKTYIFATFMRKCQVWWVKEWLFVLYQRNIYFWEVEF